jgi:hypothetical protein
MKIYELWDEEAAFLIDTYIDMNDALHVVATTYREHGEDAVRNWRLLRSTPSGEPAVPIAHGMELVHLAMKAHQAHSYAG